MSSISNLKSITEILPSEILHYIADFLINDLKSALTFRLCSSDCKKLIDSRFATLLIQLFRMESQTPVPIAELIPRIIRDLRIDSNLLSFFEELAARISDLDVGQSSMASNEGSVAKRSCMIPVFRVLEKEFISYGVQSDYLPFRPRHFHEMQNRAQANLDAALVTIWPQIKAEVDVDLDLTTADEIRTWLNDPRNAETITKVECLILSSLGLAVLPSEISKFINIELIECQNNHLKVLPASIDSLTNLTHLKFNDNEITALPITMGQLVNLESLELHNNQLQELPDSIGSLTKLTLLKLNNNKLTGLPHTISQLGKLSILELNHCELKELPDVIFQLMNLTSLSLENTQIKVLPDGITQLENLEYLDLRDNQFTERPAILDQLAQIRTLLIGGNPFQEGGGKRSRDDEGEASEPKKRRLS